MTSPQPTSFETAFAGRAERRIGDVILSTQDDVQHRREKLARVVLDQMYQFVGLLDIQGRILEINRTALDGAGVGLEDIQGRPFWEARWWAVSRDTQAAQRVYVERAAQGEFVRCDIEIFGSASGHETIVIDYSLMPVRDVEGRVVFLLAEGRNITEKKRAEAELARKHAELEALLERVRQLDRLKTEFFANLSHELRTPLTLIMGTCESLLDDGSASTSDRQVHRGLTTIRRNAVAQLHIVDDLLDLAKSDAGRLQASYRRADAAKLLRDCVAQFDNQIVAGEKAFVVDVPAALDADLDVHKFERIVLNLLSNAFKFTPRGGRIRCALKDVGSGRLLVAVQDSGPGVPVAERKRIFERFYQGNANTSDGWHGSGLGLTIVKEFIDLLAGTVTVADAPSGGALFQVELPRYAAAGVYVAPAAEVLSETSAQAHLAPAEEPVQTAQVSAVPDADARPTILVVDDNADMRSFVSEVLSEDHRVVVAGDGVEALATLETLKPDLVVTDLMMPRMDGAHLAREIRNRPGLDALPVVVLSARDDDAQRAALLADLVQDYVAKPFSAFELRARVRNQIAMKLARDALQSELDSRNLNLTQLTADLIANRRALLGNVAALQRSEQRWRSLFEHSPAGIAVIDRAERFVVLNPAFSKMVAKHPAARRSGHMMELIPEDRRIEVRERLGEIHAGMVVAHQHPLQFLAGHGDVVWANAAMAAVESAERYRHYIVLVAVDITEQRRAQTALTRLHDQVTRASRASTLGLLAASIAHEVNQPLTAVLSNAQACLRWLDAQPAALDEVRAACERIVRDSGRASQVIERTRAVVHQEVQSAESVDVVAMLDEIVDLVRESAASLDIVLLRSRVGPAASVHIDRVQMQQVILNLLTNAFDASASQPASRRVIELFNEPGDDGFVAIAVRDRGCGIDAAVRDYIFEPFHSSKPRGMGLGLAHSRAIIEGLGGKLWAVPNPDVGETFWLTLPLSSEGSRDHVLATQLAR